jgi:hypothetical protein
VGNFSYPLAGNETPQLEINENLVKVSLNGQLLYEDECVKLDIDDKDK